MHNLEKI